MSGIFKGDSIYKSGGGGGGYKDGGQLVDANFIEVKNNTVSTYDNASRNTVNFYFDVKDGEVLNSIIELTTAVNATINVYVEKNGLLYLLGNVGGDTVTAGNDYYINVIGNTYAIEQVTAPNTTPSYADIGGAIYGIKEINGVIWCVRNFQGAYGERYFESQTQDTYYRPSSVKDINVNGFRLPTRDNVESLQNYLVSEVGKKLKSTSGWWGGGNGTNESGLNILPHGYVAHPSSNVYQLGANTYNGTFIAIYNNTYYFKYTCSYDSTSLSSTNQNYSTSDMFNVRLVYNS